MNHFKFITLISTAILIHQIKTDLVQIEIDDDKNKNLTLDLIKLDDLTTYCSTNNSCQKCNETYIKCVDLKLWLMPETNFSSSLEHLILTGNNFGALNEPIFTQNMTKLTYLDLSNNNISSIENSRVFENLPALRELVLNDNELVFENENQLKSLRGLSKSLQTLSFTRTPGFKLRQPKLPDYNQITKVLLKSQLAKLEDLRLNGLVISKINNLDLLCILPRLKTLDLASSLIEEFDLNLDCAHDTQLTCLDLDNNRITTLNSDFVYKLRVLKAARNDFRIILTNNQFKCDCTLYSFYLFLRSDSSSEIVQSKQELLCEHDDSLMVTKHKPIVDSRLEKFCGGSNASFASTTGKNANTKRVATAHSGNRLLIFLACVMVISMCVLLMVKIHLRSFFRQKFHWYRTLNNSKPDTTIAKTEETLIPKISDSVTIVDNPYSMINTIQRDDVLYEDDFGTDAATTLTNKSRFSFRNLFGGKKSDTYQSMANLPNKRFNYLKTEVESSSNNSMISDRFQSFSVKNSILKKASKLKVSQLEDDEEDSDREEILMSEIRGDENNTRQSRAAFTNYPSVNVMSTRLL